MKKKLLSVLLAAAMVFSLLPMAAFAEEIPEESEDFSEKTTLSDTQESGSGDENNGDNQTENEASIGNTVYATLEEALGQAKAGDTVKLLADSSIEEMITLNKSITLDLNGYKASQKDGGSFVQIVDDATLTIDGTKEGSELYGRINLGIKDNNNGNAVLKGGIYSCCEEETVLHINGTCMNSDVTIDGATITSPDDNGIQLNGSGTFLIKDSIITGATAVYIKSGELTIQNSTLTGNMKPANYKYYGNGAYATGDAIVIDSCNYPGGKPTVNIESGVFTGTKAAIGSYTSKGSGSAVAEEAAISITGGTFSSKPDTAYIEEGKTAIPNSNGGFDVAVLAETNASAKIGSVYYADLAEAVSAAKSKDVVTLLKDVVISAGPENNIVIGQDITIDGNGKTISRSFDSVDGGDGYGNYEAFFSVEAAGVTIQNVTFKALTDAMKDEAVIYVKADGTESSPIIIEDSIFKSNGKSGLTGIITEGNAGAYLTIQDNEFTGLKYAAYFNGIANGIVSGNAVTSTTYNAFNIADNAGAGSDGADVTFRDNTLKDVAIADYNDVYSSGIYVGSDNDVRIESGSISTHGGTYNKDVYAAEGSLEITGGYFTSDPSDYLAAGKIALPSDKEGYTFMVSDKSKDAAAVVAPAAPEVKVDGSIKDGADKVLAEAVAEAAKDLAVTGGGITSAANIVANGNELTADQGKAALDAVNIPTDGATVQIVVQPYMDIQVTGANSANKTLTLDITPKYKTVATTADIANAGQIVLPGEGVTDANAVEIKDKAGDLKITKPVEISITLPDDFKDVNGNAFTELFVEHVKNGITHIYTGTVTDQVLTFTNPHGFSEFTIVTKASIAAKIGDVGYKTLQDAVDAVKDNETIKIMKADQKATVSRTVMFTVDPNNFNYTIDLGSGYRNRESGDTYDIYRKSSSDNTSGGSSSKYTLTFETNGGSKISKVTETYGTKIDLSDYKTTRSGYTFDGWYSDKDLKNEVTTITLKSSTTVYAKWTEGSEMSFTDVKSGDWFYDAVEYAYNKGLMNGTGSNQFSPELSTTRGMIVTMLWRLEGEPSAATSSFTDVAADQYYAKAVNWAVAKNVVTGMDAKTFAPNSPITREQLATILYRYAEYKEYSVKDTNDLAKFPDAGSVSSYATDAMKWAVGAGLVNGMDGKLNPTGGATRAQVATMFMRFCENIVK